MSQDEVLFSLQEFACLTNHSESSIERQLRDGKIKGSRTCKGSAWRIPESELGRFWGRLYNKQQTTEQAIEELIEWTRKAKKSSS